MIIAITGHRPDKLPDKQTGYKLPNPTYNYICQQFEKYFKELKPEKIISGMALGTDSYAAAVAIKLGIPFLAAVPFAGQENVWPDKSKKIYKQLLEKAAEIVIVSPGGYTASKLQLRNKWMVDHCDLLLAVWDQTPGGTKNCIDYAISQNKKIIYIDPKKAK